MILRVCLAFLATLLAAAPASSTGLQDYYSVGPHQICGLQTREYHYAYQTNGVVHHVTHKMPLICRHALFGLDPVASKLLPPEAQLPRTLLEAFMSGSVIPLPPYNTIPACGAMGSEQRKSPECFAAASQMGRPELMKIPLFRALEVLDNYFGSADFNDPLVRSNIEIALVFLHAHPTIAPLDPLQMVKALNLEEEMKKDPPPARIEQFVKARDSDTDIMLNITTGDKWVRQLDATVKMSISAKTQSALLQFKNGRVKIGVPPQLAAGTTSTLNSIVVNWCNPDGSNPGLDAIVEPILPIFENLEEVISASSEFRFDGIIARLPLPPTDPGLKHSWLCVATTGTANKTFGFVVGHSNDAAAKGCKNTCM